MLALTAMPDPLAPKAIFINYRRDDSGGEALHLFDDLTREFGSDKVFMDVAGIQPGLDFRKAIDSNVAGCGVLLAVIGPQWSSIANKAGLRRLDDPNDFVRLEIGAALSRNIPVIPVFVHGASMPAPEALPEPLRDLAYRNGVELSLARWRSDVDLLLPALRGYMNIPAGGGGEARHPDRPRDDSSDEEKRPSKVRWVLVGSGVAVAAVGVLSYLAFPHKQPPAATSASSAPMQVAQVEQKPQLPSTQPSAKAAAAPASVTASPPPPKASSEHRGPVATLAAPSTKAELKAEARAELKVEPKVIATPQRAASYQVPLQYNLNAIYADGMKFKAKASMDGVGDAYSPSRLVDGATGGVLNVHGVSFHTGPVNGLNALHGSKKRAVSIDLPGEHYSTLALLGAAVHQSQPSQPLLVGYGGPAPTTQAVSQGFSDWSASSQVRFPREEVAFVNTYRNTSEGSPQPGTFAVYLYRIPLDPSKPLASLTLPNNEAVVLLAMTLY